jgi:CheY-like chemotaxis protein/HPt (histidine-containing phosphotransfer) domain-containing protein
VVDDMPTNLDVAAGLLSKYKMQVDCVTNGHEAIERIRMEKPVYNAVFMDHMMPEMDGIEATDAIRSLDTEYAKRVPIIALTANAIYGTEEMFYGHGFQDFISKPIDIMELDSVVRKWVRDELHENLPSSDLSTAANISIEDDNIVIDIPGVDAELGLSLYGGELDIYLPILRSYASNTPAVLDKLKSVSEETLSDYAISVHGLKGTSANIGAETTRETAMNLERLAKSGDLEKIASINERFIKDTENIVDNIRSWFKQYDSRYKKPILEAPEREGL